MSIVRKTIEALWLKHPQCPACHSKLRLWNTKHKMRCHVCAEQLIAPNHSKVVSRTVFIMVLVGLAVGKALKASDLSGIMTAIVFLAVQIPFIIPMLGLTRFKVYDPAKEFKHQDGRFRVSYSGLDGGDAGKQRLFDALKLAADETRFIWVECKRPFRNASAVEHIEALGGNDDYLPNWFCDAYLLHFAYEKDEHIDAVLLRLVEHFHFFEDIEFVFLPDETALEKVKVLYHEQGSMAGIRKKVPCIAVYKGYQDDVIVFERNDFGEWECLNDEA